MPALAAKYNMKKEFQILKERPEIIIRITRDSVCAGDDVDAPHEKKVKTHSFTDPTVLASEISSGYLPSVDGYGHSWECVLNDVLIAVIGQNGINAKTKEVAYEEINKIHFIYKSANY